MVGQDSNLYILLVACRSTNFFFSRGRYPVESLTKTIAASGDENAQLTFKHGAKNSNTTSITDCVFLLVFIFAFALCRHEHQREYQHNEDLVIKPHFLRK